MGYNAGFRYIRNELKEIIDSDKFNKNRIEKCYIMLNSNIDFIIDDLYYYMNNFKDYNFIYSLSKLQGHARYIIFSNGAYIKIKGKEYREIIKDSLEILDDNLELFEKIYLY